MVTESLDNFGVAMSLVGGGVSGQEIVISLASDIPDVDPLGSLDSDWNRGVIVADVLEVHFGPLLVGGGETGGSSHPHG